MKSFAVHYDPEDLTDLNELSPFNLKHDIKDLSSQELIDIAESIASELLISLNHPPTVVLKYSTNDKSVSWLKVRTEDQQRHTGKSNGFRCIVLVDNKNKHAYLLHLYRHGHGEDKNISHSDENQLKEMVKKYHQELQSN